MNIRPIFKLRDPKSDGPTSINLLVFIDGQRFKYGTGLKIFPSLWEIPLSSKGRPYHEDARPTTKRSKVSEYRKGNPNIDAELGSLVKKLERIKTSVIELLGGHETPTFEQLRSTLDQICKPSLVEENKPTELNSFIDSFICEIESGARLIDSGKSKGKRYAPSTVKVYHEWKTQFHEFQGRRKFRFEDITSDFYDRYVSHFTRKNYSINSIGKHVKMLKTIMRVAYDEGLHENREFDRKRFQVLKQSVESIYLSESEIRKLYSLDLSANPQWEVIRDVFLCGCWSGQRFSDYSRLNKQHFRRDDEGNLLLDMVTKKTGERIICPVKPEFEETMKKYDFKLPKIHEQKLNTEIKLIAEEAKISESVTIRKIRGAAEVIQTVPKYKLIVSHTARRSAITNLFLAGVPTIAIMKLSGHRSEKTLLSYLKVTKQENATILARHPYFTNRMLKTI